MAGLVTLVGQHVERELPTVAIHATTEWEAVLALVYLQEGGLGVHQHVHVCCYYMHVHGGGGGGVGRGGQGKGGMGSGVGKGISTGG